MKTKNRGCMRKRIEISIKFIQRRRKFLEDEKLSTFLVQGKF